MEGKERRKKPEDF
jgi:hypothetical protein